MLRIVLLVFLVSTYSFAQNIVSGKMDPVSEDYENVIVYQLKGAKQLYVNYAAIDKKTGDFSVEIPESFNNGMYRLMFDFENTGYVDFLYSKKSIQFNFDPTFPSGTTKFINSVENGSLASYLNESVAILHNLDSLQLAFFNLKDEKIAKKTAKQFVSKKKEYLKFQSKFESESQNNIANSFIKSYKKEYPEKPIKTPQEYLNFLDKHYFDNINFNDKVLINSSFLSERVVEYVFYLNSSDDIHVQSVLFKNSVNNVMKLITDNNAKSDVLVSLLYAFANEENFRMLDFCIDNYYNKLPAELISQKVIEDVQSKVKLAIGKTAPDFSFEQEGKLVKLSDLKGAKKYVLVFWSTTCSHCLKEVPELYTYIKDNKNVEVIAISLEKDELGFNHHTEKFTKWTNVLALEKWTNPIARMYEIHSTPTYFILDSYKTIISKPEHFLDLKMYLNENKTESEKGVIEKDELLLNAK
ncbi:thioredoxin-like domain-containing protein [Lutibacter citreus]|uniref:thioredoxin-like domain-containing protein n=1 Tax=Lutibacter citreus TaxID=2138210 RepID=UPI000DBE7774|nr:thioredoxin-like domain-containing protein [Lutibacter citreus]